MSTSKIFSIILCIFCIYTPSYATYNLNYSTQSNIQQQTNLFEQKLPNNEFNKNFIPKSDFDTGINVRCACDDEKQHSNMAHSFTKWKVVNLSPWECANIIAKVGVPPQLLLSR